MSRTFDVVGMLFRRYVGRRARAILAASLCYSIGFCADLTPSELAKKVKNGEVAVAMRDGTRAEGILKNIDLATGEITLKGRKASIHCESVASVTLDFAGARVLVGLASGMGLAIVGAFVTRQRLLSNKAQGAAMAAGAASGAIIGFTAMPKRVKTFGLVCPSR